MLHDASSTIKSKYTTGRELLFGGEQTKKGIYLLNELTEKPPVLLDACITLGEYFSDRDPQKSILYYQKLISLDLNYFPDALSRLAKLEYEDDQYELALKHIETYLRFDYRGYEKEEVELSNRLRFILEAIKKPVQFSPVNLGTSVNTRNHEYAPLVRGFSEELVITTDEFQQRDTLKFNKILRKNEDIVSFTGTGWSEKRNWSEINTSDNEGCITVSADGKWMAFTQCNKKEDKGDCDIFFSYWENERWSAPKTFGPLVNTNEWESQPSFSVDGSVLVFTRERGYQQDLMMSMKGADGVWALPKELNINTSKNEHNAFLHPDGNTMYFISDRPEGMGGDDVFVTYLQKDERWSVPVNIGYPVNTKKDELSFSVSRDGSTAYFASDKKGGFGGMDIYSFELDVKMRPAVIHLEGKVNDSNGKLLSATIYIHEEGRRIYEISKTNKRGEYTFVLHPGKKYEVHAQSEGYTTSEEFILVTDSMSYQYYHRDFLLKPIVKGSATVLKSVNFVQSKDEFLPDAYPELERLALWLKSEHSVYIKLNGYTDNVGDPNANQNLSALRVKAVKAWLISKGIEEKRLTVEGFGSKNPIAPNDTEENRKKNRRVEFEIVQR